MNLGMRSWMVVVVLGAAVGLTLACSEEDPLYTSGDGGTLPVGAACNRSSDCQGGLVCSGLGKCVVNTAGAKGINQVGKPCASYADCLRELTCTSRRVCAYPGKSAKDATCKHNEECAAGLLCSRAGKCTLRGGPGAKEPGAACTATTECAFPLACLAGKCTAPAYWKGVTCGKPGQGTPRALFAVPRTGTAVTEFYGLPFPNDIRLKNGKVDLTGHPSPKDALPAPYGAVVDSLLKAVGLDVDGFGLTTTVYMRTSHSLKFESLVLQDKTNPEKVTLRFMNIHKGSPGYGTSVAYNMFVTSGRGGYICENYLTMRPALQYGVQLLPKTTYAVIMRAGVTDSAGASLTADADFKLVLADAVPADADLKAAHAAYKPLRDFIKDKGTTYGLSASTVISAAVFTTMDPHRRMAKLRQQVLDKAPAPGTKDLTLCGGASKSPCDDGLTATHKCPASSSADFHELQGTFQTAVLQAGTPPFKTEADGGVISYDKYGKPVLVSGSKYGKLCYAVTVPKKMTMPKDGWPAVIYAHGTGGSYRSFIDNGTAATLASVIDPADSIKKTGFVVISTDGALHGPRRNSADKPDALFFNVFNPRASRDNIYQGAADKVQLVRLAKAIQLASGASPTGAELKIDPKRIYFFGHSQGTVEGIPLLPYEPDFKGAVLSGAGGYLLASLLAKTKPVNIAGAISMALADDPVTLGTGHPLLNLLQLFYEEVDSINYGRAVFVKPVSGAKPRHVFLGYGVADSYTPPGTIRALAWSMGLRQVKQDAQRCGDKLCTGNETCKTCSSDCGTCLGGACGNGTCEPSSGEHCRNCPAECAIGGATCRPEFPEDTAPVRGNVTSNSQKITASVVKYSSDGSYDDHHVLSKNKTARSQSSHFLGSAVWDTESLPTVPKAQ